MAKVQQRNDRARGATPRPGRSPAAARHAGRPSRVGRRGSEVPPGRWLAITLLVGLAAYGWYRTSETRAHGHEVVAVNHSGRAIVQLNIRVAGRQLEVATLAEGATAKLPLRCDQDGTFDLAWRPRDADQERHWSGGSFHAGPVRMRHRFELVRGDGVVWRAERIGDQVKSEGKKRAKRRS